MYDDTSLTHPLMSKRSPWFCSKNASCFIICSVWGFRVQGSEFESRRTLARHLLRLGVGVLGVGVQGLFCFVMCLASSSAQERDDTLGACGLGSGHAQGTLRHRRKEGGRQRE